MWILLLLLLRAFVFYEISKFHKFSGFKHMYYCVAVPTGKGKHWKNFQKTQQFQS